MLQVNFKYNLRSSIQLTDSRAQLDPRNARVPVLHQHGHVRRGHAAAHAHAGAGLRGRHHDRLRPQERGQLRHARLRALPAAAQVVRITWFSNTGNKSNIYNILTMW